MFVRFRKDGDSYRYDNITHKLKKVFNDRDVPPSVRDLIPIICDKDGIVWVPGLKVRQGLENKNSEFIIALLVKEPISTDTQIFTLGKLNAKK
jgi:tRNA(Ile)-lysidine synthetase-like protein